MQLTRAKFFSFLAAIAAMVVLTGTALASDWIFTGEGIRVKTIVVVDVNVYSIKHYMKEKPSEKSKTAVINAEVDKKFECKMLRDVAGEKLQTAMKEAYAKNGYTDTAKINKVLTAFPAELKEGNTFSVKYDAAAKTTTFTIASQGSVTVEGVDFMKGTWSIWFGNIDQKKLGNELISKL